MTESKDIINEIRKIEIDKLKQQAQPVDQITICKRLKCLPARELASQKLKNLPELPLILENIKEIERILFLIEPHHHRSSQLIVYLALYFACENYRSIIYQSFIVWNPYASIHHILNIMKNYADKIHLCDKNVRDIKGVIRKERKKNELNQRFSTTKKRSVKIKRKKKNSQNLRRFLRK